MKPYELYKPDGEKIAVNTWSQALAIPAEFAPYVRHFLEALQHAKAIDDKPFKMLDRLREYWNFNAEVMARMEADPEFRLEEKRKEYTQFGGDILRMAEACAGKGADALARN